MTDEAKPYPKAQQLARGERRYRRKVASAKQWQRIAGAKQGPCRVCVAAIMNGRDLGEIQFHHLVPRGSPWFGDDTEDNIIPVHHFCHNALHALNPEALQAVGASLTDAEWAYIIEKVGPAVMERLFGVGRS